MKKPLLVALLIVFSISSYGQKIRFTDTSNTWNMLYESLELIKTIYTSAISFSGDTTINGKKYLLMDYAYYREDTTKNIVYTPRAWPGTDSLDTTETILYNYNWVNGDTVSANSGIYTVFKIDSTQIRGMWYKVWHFSGQQYVDGQPYDPTSFNIIEGIGCTNGNFYPGHSPTNKWFDCITCFKNKGISSPLSNPVGEWLLLSENNFDNTQCTLAAPNLSKTSISTSVFPNPIDATSKIIFPNNIQNGKLIIYNNMEQIIININVKDKEEFLIGNVIYAPGIYCYRVTDNENGTSFSGKFVCR